MDDNSELLREIEEMIDAKIASHEKRVGWVSGIIGLLFVFGIFHSVWLIKTLLP